jgi:hypothetical protein
MFSILNDCDIDMNFNAGDYTGLDFLENPLNNTKYIVFSLIYCAFILPYFSQPPSPPPQLKEIYCTLLFDDISIVTSRNV